MAYSTDGFMWTHSRGALECGKAHCKPKVAYASLGGHASLIERWRTYKIDLHACMNEPSAGAPVTWLGASIWKQVTSAQPKRSID
jgi:hypothetical protein